MSRHPESLMQPPRVKRNFLDALGELARSHVLLGQPWLGRFEDPKSMHKRVRVRS